MRKSLVSMLVLSCAVAMTGCGGGGGSSDPVATPEPTPTPKPTPVPAKLSVASNVFTSGNALPLENQCKRNGGSDLTPQLYWKDAPAGTKSYLVHVELKTTTGAKTEMVPLWTVYNVPVTTTVLGTGEDVTKISGVVVGKNNFGEAKYSAPCSVITGDTYTFKVYALNDKAVAMIPSDVPAASQSEKDIEATYKDAIVGSASIVAVVK